MLTAALAPISQASVNNQETRYAGVIHLKVVVDPRVKQLRLCPYKTVTALLLFQLWENAAHCWTDLQNYRELFYQDGLDPYRVQRQAQVSTHTRTSAVRTFLWFLKKKKPQKTLQSMHSLHFVFKR